MLGARRSRTTGYRSKNRDLGQTETERGQSRRWVVYSYSLEAEIDRAGAVRAPEASAVVTYVSQLYSRLHFGHLSRFHNCRSSGIVWWKSMIYFHSTVNKNSLMFHGYGLYRFPPVAIKVSFNDARHGIKATGTCASVAAIESALTTCRTSLTDLIAPLTQVLMHPTHTVYTSAADSRPRLVAPDSRRAIRDLRFAARETWVSRRCWMTGVGLAEVISAVRANNDEFADGRERK